MNRNLFRRLFLLMAVAVMLFAAGCTPEAVPRDAGSMAAYIGEDGLMLYRFDDQSNTLLHRGRYLSAPAFAKSGQYVYFRGGSDMFCVALDGSRAVLAAKNAKFVCVDGEAGVFFSPTEGVTRYDPISGETSVVIAQPEVGYIGSVMFSPDGSRAVYTVCNDDIGQTSLLALCVSVPGASEPDSYTSVVDHNTIPTPVAWTPDGSTCVLALSRTGSDTLSLMQFSIIDGTLSDFSGRTPQISANGELWISADGQTLIASAYRSTSDMFESLFVLDLAKHTYSYLPGGYAPMIGNTISIDGKTAAYSLGESETTAYGIFVCANDKTLLICGGEGTSYVYPTFFADGRELYFFNTAGDQISVCRAYANSSGARELVAGIAEPDGVYCKTLRDTLCIYDTTARTDDAVAE
ncbi:MAG: hypothetical protein IKU55_03230 [Clostridia bacterium]|nr:hypothetical protein [Clostridia bacterium]